jgi:tetratricopeptide (TPR) repeat protein
MVVGLAEHYARQQDPQAVASALAWLPKHPEALFEQARLTAETDPATAAQWLRQSAQANPTDGRVYMALAALQEQQGNVHEAKGLVTSASQLAPMRSVVQLEAGAFWLRQGNLFQALQHWNTVLNLGSSRYQQTLYPILLNLAENPKNRSAFQQLANESPRWWTGFFKYTAKHSNHLAAVASLYRLGQPMQSNDPDVEEQHNQEQQAYLNRLQQEGRWLAAYLAWIDGLDAQQLDALGNIYNGDFELPLADADFGWRVPRLHGVEVATASTPEAKGNYALRIVFQGRRARFRHVYQHLLLDPGHYQLQGLLRLDNFRTERGVQWTLTCKTGTRITLGASERFLGRAAWQPFSADFQVPATDCGVQELRLALAGRFGQEFEAEGMVWFDNLRIKRLD